MLNFYGHILIIFIVLILMFEALYINKFSPTKIRVAVSIVVLMIIMRYVSLLILSLTYNIKYLYLLKPFFFLNFIAVPLLALIVLYIFIRKDNINFSYIFGVIAVLIVLYVGMIHKYVILVQVNDVYGYTMYFAKNMYLYWVFIILNTVILFLDMAFIKDKNVNKLGMILVVTASLVTISEYVLWVIGMKILPENIAGDMLWAVSMVYALNRMKKKKLKSD
ncbi:hypothetical protein JMF89_02065 [Clostridiaceae bacterium UIB06]|uniref:Histidine kinase n=1 Tax=Clostridium thailandense TaxID=2794346 RepID=A0A949WQ17_9CLOT|nr:hypothetical protein [Clostridium thailandense]MBV7272151.1 hypothetical protein [Clostridium thailandense]MCH5135997.1 hypothetical protein [Clostridiaceae bacterium UIB06]